MATQLTTNAIIILLTLSRGLLLLPNTFGDMRPRAIGLVPHLPTGNELGQVQEDACGNSTWYQVLGTSYVVLWGVSEPTSAKNGFSTLKIGG